LTLATLVYLLCLASALACTALLLRSYWHSRAQLLLWAAAGFALLTVNNLLLVADMMVFRGVDLWWPRQAVAAGAIGVFLYGFLWKAEP
jgi:hypothetical protein